MLLISKMQMEQWSPDFSSSGQANPSWTRLTGDGSELTNSIEFVEWSPNPVQVRLCEQCGHIDCEPGGYVHVSRFGRFVIWSAPQIEIPSGVGGSRYESIQVIRDAGSLAFSKDQWSRIHEVCSDVPRFRNVARASGLVIADGWRLASKVCARVESIREVTQVLTERLVGTDRLDSSEAISRLSHILDWLDQTSSDSIEGDIRLAREIDAHIETFYFDGPKDLDWPGIAVRGDSTFLAVSKDSVLVFKDAP